MESYPVAVGTVSELDSVPCIERPTGQPTVAEREVNEVPILKIAQALAIGTEARGPLLYADFFTNQHRVRVGKPPDLEAPRRAYVHGHGAAVGAQVEVGWNPVPWKTTNLRVVGHPTDTDVAPIVATEVAFEGAINVIADSAEGVTFPLLHDLHFNQRQGGGSFIAQFGERPAGRKRQLQRLADGLQALEALAHGSGAAFGLGLRQVGFPQFLVGPPALGRFSVRTVIGLPPFPHDARQAQH